jgi:hypothetical protein
MKIFYREKDGKGSFLKEKRYSDETVIALVRRLEKGEVMSPICIAEKEEDLE